MFQVTYNKILEVQNLKPFSSYVFYVALKNYYTNLEGVSPVIGPPTIFQTAAGGNATMLHVTGFKIHLLHKQQHVKLSKIPFGHSPPHWMITLIYSRSFHSFIHSMISSVGHLFPD